MGLFRAKNSDFKLAHILMAHKNIHVPLAEGFIFKPLYRYSKEMENVTITGEKRKPQD